MAKKGIYSVLKSEKIFSSNWFNLTHDIIQSDDERSSSSSKPFDYFFVDKKPTVFIIPATNDGKILLVNEYRYPINKNIWQLPAGMIDGNESPEGAGKRELKEETNYVSGEWENLGHFYVAPGHENTEIFIVFANNVTQSGEENPSAEEVDIKETRLFDQDEIKSMIKEGRIECGITIASLMKYFLS